MPNKPNLMAEATKRRKRHVDVNCISTIKPNLLMAEATNRRKHLLVEDNCTSTIPDKPIGEVMSPNTCSSISTGLSQNKQGKKYKLPFLMSQATKKKKRQEMLKDTEVINPGGSPEKNSFGEVSKTSIFAIST